MYFVAMSKCKFEMVAILFALIFLMVNRVESYIVNLYDKTHFYELDVEQYNGVENFKQSFNYEIDDKGCLKSKSASAYQQLDNNLKNRNDFNLNTEVFIYSNHEKTLSFTAQIKFQPIRSSDYTIRGYEMVFQQEGVSDKCIRIMIKHIKVSNIKSIAFTIKDPAFMNLNNTQYSFFFGTVYVRPLVHCNNYVKGSDESLCALDSIRSETLKIGIRSEGLSDLKPIEPDECQGDLMKQTCIIRYIDKNDYNCIIMHPQSDRFERLLGDTDITKLNDEQQKIVNEAIDNGKPEVILGGIKYQTSLVQKDYVGLISNVESLYRQRLPDGLVIKFLKCPISINYVGLLDTPTNTNPCKNNSENKFCPCNGECRACSQISKNLVRYVPLNLDEKDSTKLAKRSNTCDINNYFKSFSFDKVNTVKMFQNQPISINKIEIASNSSDKMANRDTLPRLCFEIEKKDTFVYTLNIILNDYTMTGKSTQIETSYLFSMYTVFRDKTLVESQQISPNNMRKIKTESILNLDKKLYANDSIVIENLTRGTYLIELLPVQRSAYCPKDECVDEGFYNNQIQCVKCNKLITFFYLNDNMLANNNNEKDANNLKKNKEIKHKLKPNFGLKKKIITHVETFDVSKAQNSHFKCSIDSLPLKNILNASMVDVDTLSLSRPPTDYTFYNTEIYSSVSVNSFKPTSFLLPYKDMIMMDQNDIYEDKIIDLIFESNLTTARLAIFSIVIVIILIVSFIAITYCVISGFSNGFPIHRKRVVVYLSVFIKNNDLKILSEFTTKFISGIKKKFGDMDIVKIDNDSEKNNFELIEHADLIFYICGNEGEQDLIENTPNTMFAIKESHHDFNKIHYDRKCQEKTFNLIFENSHQPRMSAKLPSSSKNRNDLTTSSKMTHAHLFIDMNNQSNQISLALTENLSVDQKNKAKANHNNIPAQSINPHKFLRVPKETNKLVSVLLSHESNAENQDFSYVRKSKSLGSKFIHWMINKLYTYSLNKTYKNEIKRYKRIFSIELVEAET